MGSDELLNVNDAPCGYSFSSWCSFTWDSGVINAVYHIGPNTPDGTYPVNFVTHTGYQFAGFTATVSNGAASPVTIVSKAGIDFAADGGKVQLVTTDGASASLTRHDNYLGMLGQPYPAAIPPGQGKVATLDIYINSAPPILGTNDKDNDVKSGGNQCGKNEGMARYSVHSMLVSLNVVDTPLRYAPSVGPAIDFTVTYNQKETQQPVTFSYSNLGPKWTFNWLSYVSDDPNAQLPLTSLFVHGGGAEIYAFNSTSQTFLPDPQSHATLVKIGDNYERRLPDGSKQIFGLSDNANSYPRRIFMTQMKDPAGNPVTIGYDTSFRVVSIKDALNQVTVLSYELASDPLKITKVTDPFNRFATFQYSAGHLATITDEIGIQSQFTYLTGTDSIDSVTTQYGTTTFVSGQSGTNRWIEMTDPLGGKERVEYRDQATGITASDPVAPDATGITNAGLNFANTFYWDKKATMVAPGDYTRAKITHWLYNADGSVSGIASSEKQPLENRVWYTYAGQSDYQHAAATANPSQLARVVGDGTTQLSQYEYNTIGKTTKVTDAVNRVTSSVYDTNSVDLLEVRQMTGTNNDLLRKFSYNSLHEPLTDTDAAGQVTTYTYNTVGQMLTSKNAKNETTTFAYGGTVPDGCLASITSPPFNAVSAVTSFTYDSFKRVRTVTNSPDNYIVTSDYDNLDRKIKVTYPDTTFEQFKYTDNATSAMTLDLTGTRDRRGLWTYRHYNANQQTDSIKDPENRTTLYGWCTCGALTSITDPKNKTTTFNRDLQSRVYQKVFADTTTIDYLYEGQTAPNTAGATGRLKSQTDSPRGTATNYQYFADDTLKQITYSDSTPAVSYTYDPNYNRPVTMVDGTGATTYGYNPITASPALGAGRLASVDGPLANDIITYSYDELGRELNHAINGVSDAVTYDSLGRVESATNPLGAFSYGYVGVTSRLDTLSYPNGQSANYSYFANDQDNQLQTIRNLKAGSVNLSRFDYVYDKEHQIKQWTKQFDTAASKPLYFNYDYADQLLDYKNSLSWVANSFRNSFVYDPAGNRQSDTSSVRVAASVDSNTTRTTAVNSVNQLLTVQGPAPQSPGADPDLPPPPPPPDSFSYDSNGNTVRRDFSDGGGNTFEWDAANRLKAITYVGNTNRTEFSYDGLNRRSKIVEKTGTTVTSTKQFVWIGMTIAQERGANNDVTKRFYSQGFQSLNYQPSTTNSYYYSRDHLGSIREVTDTTGILRARYDYDPFGNTTKLTGDLDADFGYTGHYRHAASNLYLAPYRAYDPTIARWLSRDPLENAEMSQGPNLYAYVDNSPINNLDPLGLDVEGWRQIFHSGIVMNPTGDPLLVSGNNPNGHGQLQYVIPPWTIFPSTPFHFNDVDAVYYNNQTIRINSIAGSWINLPSWLRPDDYNSWVGWLLRGFGWDALIGPNDPLLKQLEPPHCQTR